MSLSPSIEGARMMSKGSWGAVGTRFMAVVLVFCFTGAAMAGVTSYFGDTTGDPTWQRTVANSGSLSGIATAVPYETQVFSVSHSGYYTITSAYMGYDGYLHLYAGSFDPADQFANLVMADDDYHTLYAAQLTSVSLSSGVDYIVVNSGFTNGDYGVYNTTIGGCGQVQLGCGGCPAIPAPASLGLVAVGCLSLLRRGRR